MKFGSIIVAIVSGCMIWIGSYIDPESAANTWILDLVKYLGIFGVILGIGMFIYGQFSKRA